MANRSYLYALNAVPALGVDPLTLEVTGLSEYAYDIPLAFKLLVSGNPRACPSLVWDEGAAILGEYGAGVQRLEAFLARLEHPQAAEFTRPTLEFLRDPRNVRRFILLEPDELFMMDDADPTVQLEALLQNLQHLEPEIEDAVQRVRDAGSVRAQPTGWLGRLFKPAPVTEFDPTRALIELGLGHWSNVLYFDFTAPDEMPDSSSPRNA